MDHEQQLAAWCGAFMAYVPQHAADEDDRVTLMRSACVKVLGTPPGDDWRLTVEEASAVIAAFRTWPDGRVGADPEIYTAPEMRAACTAWLATPKDADYFNWSRPQDTRSACQKITSAPSNEPPDLSWDEAHAIRLMIRDAADWQWVQKYGPQLQNAIRPRTALGRAWDRLRGR